MKRVAILLLTLVWAFPLLAADQSDNQRGMAQQRADRPKKVDLKKESAVSQAVIDAVMKANLTIEVYLTNEKGDRIRQITSGLVELRSHPLSPGLVMESQLHTPCTFNVPKNRDYKIEVTVNPREEHLRRDIQEGTKGRIIHLDGNMTETFTFISE